PAVAAISSTEAPWKPLLANTLRAASSRRSRVWALLCSRVMRAPGRDASLRAGPGAGAGASVTLVRAVGALLIAAIVLDRVIAITITFIIRVRGSASERPPERGQDPEPSPAGRLVERSSPWRSPAPPPRRQTRPFPP